MNLSRRRAHRAIWTLLAATLPLLFVLALRARHEVPVEPLPPALATPQPSED